MKGISYEADRKHAEAIIRETGASNLTPLKIPLVQREQGGSARQNRRHCGEEKVGKVGMKEQPLIGQILSPAETIRYSALAATANFLAIDRGDIVHCAEEWTRHMAAATTADWEKVVRLERYLKNKHTVRLSMPT